MHMWVVLWVFWTKGGAECPKRFPGPHWPRTIPSNMLPHCHLSGPLTFQTTSQTLFVTLTDLFRLLSHKLGHKSALVSDKGEDEVASSLHRPSNLQLFNSKTRTTNFYMIFIWRLYFISEDFWPTARGKTQNSKSKNTHILKVILRYTTKFLLLDLGLMIFSFMEVKLYDLWKLNFMIRLFFFSLYFWSWY